jgi:hypothetical protein
MAVIERLHATIGAVAPIQGLAVLSTSPVNVRIDFAPEATAEQQTAAQAALAAFDWSPEADAAARLIEVRAAAEALVDGGDLNPLAMKARAALLLLVDELNELAGWIATFKQVVADFTGATAAAAIVDLKARTAATSTPAQHTVTQVRGAIKNKVSGGLAD